MGVFILNPALIPKVKWMLDASSLMWNMFIQFPFPSGLQFAMTTLTYLLIMAQFADGID